MSKKTLALIAVLLLASVILIVLAVRQQPEGKKMAINTPTPTPTPAALATMAMTPNPVTLTGSLGKLNVTIDTNIYDVTAVQLEIAYDPAVLANVDITPGPFFTNPVQLIKTINTQTGRISYALGIATAQNALNGTGVVARMTFSRKFGTTGAASQTEISFLPKSLVTAKGVTPSVLKTATGTVVLLGSPTASSSPQRLQKTSTTPLPAQTTPYKK